MTKFLTIKIPNVFDDIPCLAYYFTQIVFLWFFLPDIRTLRVLPVLYIPNLLFCFGFYSKNEKGHGTNSRCIDLFTCKAVMR